jgi:hypothetical protein
VQTLDSWVYKLGEMLTIHLAFVLLLQLGELSARCQIYREIVKVKLTEPNCMTTEVFLPVCHGTCGTSSYVVKSDSEQTEIEHELSCCMPTKYRTVTLTFLGFDGVFRQKQHKAIEECGCYPCTVVSET